MQPHDTTNDIPYGYCHCGCGGKTNLLPYNLESKGWVKGQPRRFIYAHNGRVQVRRPPAERFWEKVDMRGPDDCWEWTAGRFPAGYGCFQFMNRQSERSNRVAWILTYGPIPKGKLVMHMCNNPPCCNPSHLQLGNQKRNMRYAADQGRMRQPDNRGEAHGMSKLTAPAVRDIRCRAAAGEPRATLAKEYGVSKEAIRAVVNRKSWRHIP